MRLLACAGVKSAEIRRGETALLDGWRSDAYGEKHSAAVWIAAGRAAAAEPIVTALAWGEWLAEGATARFDAPASLSLAPRDGERYEGRIELPRDARGGLIEIELLPASAGI